MSSSTESINAVIETHISLVVTHSSRSSVVAVVGWLWVVVVLPPIRCVASSLSAGIDLRYKLSIHYLPVALSARSSSGQD